MDIWGAIKLWKNTDDFVLKEISKMFLTRNLFKIHFSNTPFKRAEIDKLRLKTQNKLAVSDDELKYFFSEGEISNYGYLTENKILILTKRAKSWMWPRLQICRTSKR